MTSVQIQIDEEMQVRQAICEIRLPAGVRFNRLVLSSDWEGDPAWDIYFDIPKGAKPTEEFLNSLQDLRSEVHHRVFSVGTDKFPYVHFKEPV
jgi:hypothetical protein